MTSEKEIELLNCPFDNGKSRFRKSAFLKGLWTVKCQKCRVTCNYFHSKKLAAEFWNTRPGESQWTPISEGLPVEAGIYLVTYYDQSSKKNKTFPCYFDKREKEFRLIYIWGSSRNKKSPVFWSLDNPIAYQSLPKAYEGK